MSTMLPCAQHHQPCPPPAQGWASALLAVWAAASLARAFRRVRLPLSSATTAAGPSGSITNGVKQA